MTIFALRINLCLYDNISLTPQPSRYPDPPEVCLIIVFESEPVSARADRVYSSVVCSILKFGSQGLSNVTESQQLHM